MYILYIITIKIPVIQVSQVGKYKYQLGLKSNKTINTSHSSTSTKYKYRLQAYKHP